MTASAQTSPEDVQTILTHIQEDAEFRRLLLQDPEAALATIGVKSNEEIVGALVGLDEASLEDLARSFGTDSAASC
jgi:putative modified peptide